MSDVVVDASLAFKWLIPEPDSADADARYRDWRRRRTRIVVPGWFACELANALYQQVWRGRVSTPRAGLLLRAALRRVAVLDPQPLLSLRALEIAALLNQRASYDAQYVALAEHLGCELWTADARFGRAAQSAFPFVHWLGEPPRTTI